MLLCGYPRTDIDSSDRTSFEGARKGSKKSEYRVIMSWSDTLGIHPGKTSHPATNGIRPTFMNLTKEQHRSATKETLSKMVLFR